MLGHDDKPHGLGIVKAQTPSCFKLPFFNAADTTSEDFSHVGTELIPNATTDSKYPVPDHERKRSQST